MSAISAASRGEVVIVSLVHQGFTTVVARQGRRLADLGGEKLGYRPGTSAHWACCGPWSCMDWGRGRSILCPTMI